MSVSPPGEADLRLTLSPIPCPAVSGHSICYQAAVYNAGPDPASCVQLTCTLPAVLINCCFRLAQVPVWNFWPGRIGLGSIPPGFTRIVFLSGEMPDDLSCPLVCSASAVSPTPDPILRNNVVTLAAPPTLSDGRLSAADY